METEIQARLDAVDIRMYTYNGFTYKLAMQHAYIHVCKIQETYIIYIHMCIYIDIHISYIYIYICIYIYTYLQIWARVCKLIPAPFRFSGVEGRPWEAGPGGNGWTGRTFQHICWLHFLVVNLCIYIYIHACMYVCMYVFIHLFIYLCIMYHVYVSVDIDVYVWD